jgi:hypothetical protein
MVKGLFGVTSRLRRPSLVFYIANDCLSAAIHVDVFDADILVPPMAQASENLYLHRIRFHQTSRSKFRIPIKRNSLDAIVVALTRGYCSIAQIAEAMGIDEKAISEFWESYKVSVDDWCSA